MGVLQENSHWVNLIYTYILKFASLAYLRRFSGPKDVETEPCTIQRRWSNMRKPGSNSRDECLSKSDCPQKGLENAAGPPPLRIQTRISEEGGREKIPSGTWGRSPSSLSPNGPATLTLMPSPFHPLKVLVRNRVGTHLHFGRTPDHLLWKWPVPGGPTIIPHCRPR